MENKHFVKYMRNPNILEAGKLRPTAILLLLLVVNRAKNTEGGNPDLQIGEAYIGDYKSYGVTEQIYRSDKSFLEKWQILTFKATNKGTIAKLANRDYFDVDWENPTNELTNKQTEQQRTTNGQPTTNREIRNKKEDTNNKKTLPLKEKELTPDLVNKIWAELEKASDQEIAKKRRPI